MKSLGKYVRKKKLVKIMVFNKRNRMSEDNEWKREGRKENRMNEGDQVLGLHLQRENHGQGTHERASEEDEQGSGMCMGNKRKKVEK
jgi:hypothetical protein